MIRSVAVLILMGMWPLVWAAPGPLCWRWSNPKPFGANVSDLVHNQQGTVAVGERGQVYTSEDLSRWTPRRTGTDQDLRSAVYFGSRLIISGEAGTVLYADSLDRFELVELGTADWLEALAASPQLVVAAGDEGAIYTSADGESWNRVATPFAAWLRGAAFGSGRFVVVGEDGFIATSLEGTTWTTRVSGTDDHLNAVSWVGDRFLAVGNQGVLLESLDGTVWSKQVTGAVGPLYAVDGLGADWVVVGGGELRRRQPNGTWKDELTAQPQLPTWTYSAIVKQGSTFLIGGRSGMLLEGSYESPSLAWIQRVRPIRNWLWEMKALPDRYVTVGYNGTIMTSANGIDWGLEWVPGSVADSIFLGVGGTTNLLLAAGSDGSVLLSRHVPTSGSTLGVVWHALEPRPTTEDLQGVAAWGSQFILTGSQGTILTSSDGTNWTRQTAPTQAFLSGVTSFPGGLVTVGDRGTVLVSEDAIHWTAKQSGTTNWIYRVRYFQDQLIAVGEAGTILTSPDGQAWVQRQSGSPSWLADAVLIDGCYYVIGTQGTVLTSSNAIDWLPIGIPTGKALYGAASRDGQLVVCGVEGAILRTQLQPHAEPARLRFIGRQDDCNLFRISGFPDERWTLEHSVDNIHWSSGPSVEILDTSGAVLLRQPRNAAADPPHQFYRVRLEH